MPRPAIPNMPANVDLKIDLADQLKRRRLLRLEYQYVQVLAHLAVGIYARYTRRSFSDIVSFFGHPISLFIMNKCRRRKTQLSSEADRVALERTTESGPDVDEDYVYLKTHLELETILCTEYR